MKKNGKFALGIIILSLMVAFFIGIGVSLPLFPKMTNANEWIGFWGSYAGAVIGGVITMMGVSMTIQSESRNEIKPYLILYEIEGEDIPKSKAIDGCVDEMNGGELIDIVIKIKNVGKGVAKNIILRKNNQKDILKFSVIEYEPGYNEVYFSIMRGFDIPHLIKPSDKKAIIQLMAQQRTSVFTISYEDLLGNKYSYDIFS